MLGLQNSMKSTGVPYLRRYQWLNGSGCVPWLNLAGYQPGFGAHSLKRLFYLGLWTQKQENATFPICSDQEECLIAAPKRSISFSKVSLIQGKPCNYLESQRQCAQTNLCERLGKSVAGMVGFEPTIHCTKNSCLTTWLHPNVRC